MTNGELNEVSRSIGGLEASVRNLTRTWQQQDREATEGRRALHAKIEELKSQQQQLASKVDQQTVELAEVKPAIKRFEAQRQRQEGARSLLVVFWTAVTTFAAGLGYVAHELMVFFWPPKH